MTYPISTEPEGPITDDNGDELEHGEPDRPSEVEAAWFALGRDFTYTGPHDRESAHGIVAHHRPIIEAALRSTAPALDGQILHTLEPDPVYVTARAVVASHFARPFDGTALSRSVHSLAAALEGASGE